MYHDVINATVIPLFLSLAAMFIFTAIITGVLIRFKGLTMQKHNYLVYSLATSASGLFSIWAGMVIINYTPLAHFQEHLMEMYLILPAFIFSPMMFYINRKFHVQSGGYFLRELFVAIYYLLNAVVFMEFVFLWRP